MAKMEHHMDITQGQIILVSNSDLSNHYLCFFQDSTPDSPIVGRKSPFTNPGHNQKQNQGHPYAKNGSKYGNQTPVKLPFTNHKNIPMY